MPWISAGASLLGGLMSSDAAGDAASAQAAASKEANDLQRYIYDNNVKLNQPAIDAGNLGRNKLLQLLGLGGTPGGQPTQTREQLRTQLLSQYTKPGATSGYGADQWLTGNQRESTPDIYGTMQSAGPSTVDENGLTAAINAAMNNGSGVDSTAGDYGSLLKEFTGADLENEPGYQFGLAEGNKALDRRAASGGGYFSGAALKAAQRYGQDYAGTKYGEAFNRDTTNKNNIYNRLSGLTNGAQVATSQVGTAGTNYANSVGNNLTNNANAQGAAGIAQSNAWNSGINGAVNAYQNYNANNALARNIGSGYTPPYYDYGVGGPQ